MGNANEIPAGAAADLAAFNDAMKGRRCVGARYMTAEEAEQSGLTCRPVVILFEKGAWIAPLSDDEGNDGGALAVEGVDALRFGLLGVV